MAGDSQAPGTPPVKDTPLKAEPSDFTVTHRRAPPMFSELDTVGGAWLPRSRFGMCTEPGAHQPLLGVHRVCWCCGSALAQLSQL